MCDATTTTHMTYGDMFALDELAATNSSSSILEFLNHEKRCLLTETDASKRLVRASQDDNGDDDDDDDTSEELDIESIFSEIQRLSGGICRSGGGDGCLPERTVDEILREAEELIGQQEQAAAAAAAKRAQPQNLAVQQSHYTTTGSPVSSRSRLSSGRGTTRTMNDENDAELTPVAQPVSSPSCESTVAAAAAAVIQPHRLHVPPPPTAAPTSVTSTGSSTPQSRLSSQTYSLGTRSSPPPMPAAEATTTNVVVSHSDRSSTAARCPLDGDSDESDNYADAVTASGHQSSAHSSPVRLHQPRACVDRATSPVAVAVDDDSFSRERRLEHTVDALRESLKDTEERLHALRLQHDRLADAHRELRDTHDAQRTATEALSRDCGQLHECAAALRTEVQTARADREEALRVQRQLTGELADVRQARDAALERRERDGRTVQDLQRQCREMERILMRKHPDSVSALIVAAKNPGHCGDHTTAASRRLLEQRIAQLEADAREQDAKAQQILANVQSRFSTVQSKYEQHIGDLETQVISLQQINARLNEKIAAHLNRNHQITGTQATQTMDVAEHDTVAATRETAAQTDGRITGVAATGKAPTSSHIPRPGGTKADCCAAHVHNAARDDAHLMATLRGMRVDLAIKEKAMQRLTRDLDECKRTIRKLQREKDALLAGNKRPPATAAAAAHHHHQQLQLLDFDGEHSSSNNNNNSNGCSEATSVALKEYLNRIKLLEFDYNALHDKRLQDLKTLQAAHERELASCQATVNILQQRLTERDVAFDAQKRREQDREQDAADRRRELECQQQNHTMRQHQHHQQQQQHQQQVPVDYMALKAKVSSLERRHSEREQRLHILVDALSKGGRLAGTPFDNGASSVLQAAHPNRRSAGSAIPIMSMSATSASARPDGHKPTHKLPVRKCKG